MIKVKKLEVKIKRVLFPKKASAGKSDNHYILDVELCNNSELNSILEKDYKSQKEKKKTQKVYGLVANGKSHSSLSKGSYILLDNCKIEYNEKFSKYNILFEKLTFQKNIFDIFNNVKGLGEKSILIIKDILNKEDIKLEELCNSEKGTNTLISYGIKNSTKLNLIKRAWGLYTSESDIIEYLYSIGFNSNQVSKIYKKHSIDSKQIILANIFNLLEIKGITFEVLDSIYLSKLGGKITDEHRLSKGLMYYVDKTRELSGDMFVLEEDIIGFVKNELRCSINDVLVKNLLKELTVFGDIIIVDNGKHNCYYSNNNYQLEISTVKKLLEYVKVKQSLDIEKHIDIDEEIKQYEIKKGRVLNAEQLAGVKSSLLNPISIITGGPGTGKTTIQDCIITLIEKYNRATVGVEDQSDDFTRSDFLENVLVVAPTGIASKRIADVIDFEAFTLHRGLEYNPFGGFMKGENNKLDKSFVIGDETSMVSLEMFLQLLSAIDFSKTNSTYIGDVDQIPSMGAGQILHDMIESGVIPVVKLTKTYRSDAYSIIENSKKMRAGQTDLIFDHATVFHELNTKDNLEEKINEIVRNGGNKSKIYEYSKKIDEEYEAQYKKILLSIHRENDLKKDNSTILSPIKKGFAGVKETNNILQDYYNENKKSSLASSRRSYSTQFGKEDFSVPLVKTDDYVFYKGDKVLNTKNDYDKDILNGSIGIIDESNTVYKGKQDKKNLSIGFDGDKDLINLTGKQTNNISLGYSITVHKSQGSEYPYVIIPVFRYFGAQMLYWRLYYTALTRGKKKVIFIGKKSALDYAIRNRNMGDKKSNLGLFLQGKISNI